MLNLESVYTYKELFHFLLTHRLHLPILAVPDHFAESEWENYQ